MTLFILLELLDPLFLVPHWRCQGVLFFVVVDYKADLEGHKGTRKWVQKLSDNYLFELLSFILIHNSQL